MKKAHAAAQAATRELPNNLADFWELARAAWTTTKHLVDKDVQNFQHASIDEIRYILLQYRWFTSYYTGDLAILIYKLPPSSLRSLLGQCLTEELGMGDPSKTHPAMFDNFLLTLGVAPEDLENDVDPRNLALLEDFRQKLLAGHYIYGIGLRGMGAECLCQVYLEAVHHHLIRNEEIIKRRKDLDWSFWDIHASEADQMHGEMTRTCIEHLASKDNISLLAAGYLEAEQMFLQFWNNAYRGRPVASEAKRRDAVPLDGWRYDPAR